MSKQNSSLSEKGIYYLIYNVLNIAFPFFTGVYVARILLPQTIGEVAAAQNLATYFVILAFLGIPTYGLREIAKSRDDRSERNRVFSELYIINLISTIIFTIFYYATILVIPAYSSQLPLYCIVGFSIILNAFNISWLYEGLEEFKFISIRNLVFKALSFICLICFVKSSDDYLVYAAITVFGTAGNYIVNMIYSPKFASITTNALNLKRHLKPVLLLVTVNLAIEIYSLVDITMMNFISTDESIAYYKYGMSIQKILLQIVNTFTMVLVPRISYYYKQGRQVEFDVLVSKGMKLILITAIPMIVGIFFTADSLITCIYGDQYLRSSQVLKVLSLALLIAPTGYLLGSRMLLVTNHESKMVICVGVGAVINVIGNSILISRFSEIGASIASIISELAIMCLYVSYGRRYFSLIRVRQTFVRVLIAACIMGLYLYGCSQLPLEEIPIVILQICGAMIVYAIGLIVLKEEIVSSYLAAFLKRDSR